MHTSPKDITIQSFPRAIFLLVYIITATQSLHAQKAIDMDDFSQSLNFYHLGMEKVDSNAYSESLKYFHSAINMYDKNADIYAARANSYFKLNLLDSAIADIEKAMQLTTGHADYHYLKANILYRRGEHEQAIHHYDSAILLNITSSVKVSELNCYYNRGNAKLSLKKSESAINDFNVAIAIDSAFENAFHNRGIAHRQLGMKDDACRDFRKAFELGSAKSERYLTRYCIER